MGHYAAVVEGEDVESGETSRSGSRHRSVLAELDYQRIAGAVAWLRANPTAAVLIRQLPIEGVDTKWLARHARIVLALLGDIRAGHGDVLVVWEISRKERDLAVYVKIRDPCLAVGLNFGMVGNHLYDLRDKNDGMNLGIQAVQAPWLADSIRDTTWRRRRAARTAR